MKKTEDQVIEENYGLAMSLARKFYRKTPSFSFEDLLQVSLMSMLKAHRKYNSDRSVFSTFATYCMRNDLIKFVNIYLNSDSIITLQHRDSFVEYEDSQGH